MTETHLVRIIPPGGDRRADDTRFDRVIIDPSASQPRTERRTVATTPSGEAIPKPILEQFQSARENAPDNDQQQQIDIMFKLLFGVDPENIVAVDDPDTPGHDASAGGP